MRSRVLLVIALLLAASNVSGGVPAGDPKLHTCTQFFGLKSGRSAYGPIHKGVSQPACVWKKRKLQVRFTQGDPVVQQKVQKIAKEWTAFSHVELEFGDFADADLRIAFQPGGSWSYVGQCQWDHPNVTMNFGWLTPSTPDEEYHRVVLHEFGHALGLVHEHQNPAGNIPWNKAAVFDYYKKTQGWDQHKTEENVIKKYSEAETNHTQYDPKSIMEYPIPKDLTVGGFEVGWNRALSDLDKKFIGTLYP